MIIEKPKPVVVGISGASKAGKSTLAGCLQRRLCGAGACLLPRRCPGSRVERRGSPKCRVGVLCQDYIHRKEVPRERWDDPDALDHDAIFAALNAGISDATLDYFVWEGFKAMTTAISYKLYAITV